MLKMTLILIKVIKEASLHTQVRPSSCVMMNWGQNQVTIEFVRDDELESESGDDGLGHNQVMMNWGQNQVMTNGGSESRDDECCQRGTVTKKRCCQRGTVTKKRCCQRGTVTKKRCCQRGTVTKKRCRPERNSDEEEMQPQMNSDEEEMQATEEQ